MLGDFVRLTRSCGLSLQTMYAAAASSLLDARLAELAMSALCPCDLGDGIEVVHDDDESIEIEMECDVDDDDAPPDDAGDTIRFPMMFDPADELASTTEFRQVSAEDIGTHQFVRYSAPYERIEIAVDPQAYLRATIEDAKRLTRSASA